MEVGERLDGIEERVKKAEEFQKNEQIKLEALYQQVQNFIAQVKETLK